MYTTAQQVLTGIKGVDWLSPYAKGGKIGFFGGAGVGKMFVIMESIECLAKENFAGALQASPNAAEVLAAAGDA